MASKPAVLLFTIVILSIQTLLSGAVTSSMNVVVGRVFCDTCLEGNGYMIPGALVAAECSIDRKTKSRIYSIEGETDENGEFRLEIPGSLKRCSLRMISSPEGSCDIPSTTAPSHLGLSSNSIIGTYNAGSFSYRPLNVPPFCHLRRRAALEEASPTAATPPLIPNLPKFNFPPFPFPLPKQSNPSFPLPRVPPFPFPFPFPSPPPGRQGESSKANSESPPNISETTVPPLPKSTVPPLPARSFPPIPSIPPTPSLPIPRIPLPPQFPPIPFLNPPPPPAP